MMMYEIAKTSEEMVSKRKEMMTENPVEDAKLPEGKEEEIKGETGKQRRQRLHDAKRAKQKQKEGQYARGKEKTQEEINQLKNNP